MRGMYKGLLFTAADSESPQRTVEGVRGLDDTIAQLRSMSPLKPIRLSQELTLAAADHLVDTVFNDLSGAWTELH
jgi:hypothetical protein